MFDTASRLSPPTSNCSRGGFSGFFSTVLGPETEGAVVVLVPPFERRPDWAGLMMTPTKRIAITASVRRLQDEIIFGLGILALQALVCQKPARKQGHARQTKLSSPSTQSFVTSACG